MRPVTARTAGLLGGLLLTAAPAFAGTVDQKLLDMLLANGSITAAQHAELTGDLAKEQRKAERAEAKTVKTQDMATMQQKLAWAMNTQFRGDVRVRHENVHIENESDNLAGGGRDRDRQRFRARLGAFSQVNPEVEAGIQLASGNSDDRRSPNQDLNNAFTKKSVWLDLAYIDYHPLAVPGLKVFGGKMKQPWLSMGDVIWDGDTNPEGLATTYSRKWGLTELFGSAGYYTLKDNVDGEGYAFKHDLRMYAAQLGTNLYPGDSLKLTLGGSLYAFDNADNDYAASPRTIIANGNTSSEYNLAEAFSELSIIGLPLPLSLYGQYVTNTAADGPHDDDDTAWLFGFKTALFNVALDYNYRDVERNGVVGAFTDSDFADGYVGSHGHKLKLAYDISKNFNFTATYFAARSDVASRFDNDDAAVNRLQLDLNARF